MARPPRTGNTRGTPKASHPLDKKECTCCHRLLSMGRYYKSKNILSGDGHANMCKDCIKSKVDYGNMETVYDVLRSLDLPFFYNYWVNCVEKTPNNIIGNYIRMANSGLNEFVKARWDDSYFYPSDSYFTNNEQNAIKKNITPDEILENLKAEADAFKATPEVITKWGSGYSMAEYQAFEKKYDALKNNYPQKTAMHTEALLKYIRYSVKEEFAVAKGNVAEAGKWADLANKSATNAKINPSQLTKADLTDGLSTFSELSQAVEKEVDIIPILPRFKYRPNDALDFNIWCYVNYIRDLLGLPQCEYEDVYKFYDKRVEDYVAQYGDPYGIFTNDPTKENRPKIETFIKEDS